MRLDDRERQPLAGRAGPLRGLAPRSWTRTRAASAWIRLGSTAPLADRRARRWPRSGSSARRGEACTRAARRSPSTGCRPAPAASRSRSAECVLEASGAAGRVDEARLGSDLGRRSRRDRLGRRRPGAAQRTGDDPAGDPGHRHRRSATAALSVQGWPAHQVHAWGSRHAEASARRALQRVRRAGDFVEALSRRHARRGAAPVVDHGRRRHRGRGSTCRAARGGRSRADFGPERYTFAVARRRTDAWPAGPMHGRRPASASPTAILTAGGSSPTTPTRRHRRRDPPPPAPLGNRRRWARTPLLLRVPVPHPGGRHRGAAVSARLRGDDTGFHRRCGGTGGRPAPDGCAFTSRLGGVSEGPFASLNLGALTADDPARVAENRRRAVAAAGADAPTATMAWQVHGADVREVTGSRLRRASCRPGVEPFPKSDGLVTSVPGRPMMLLTADCLPIAIARQDGAGWRCCTPAGAGWRPASPRPAPLPSEGRPWRRSARAPGRAATRSATTWPFRLRARFGDDVVRDGRADLWLCAQRALQPAGVASRGRRRRVHDLHPRALLLAPPGHGRHRAPGRGGALCLIRPSSRQPGRGALASRPRRSRSWPRPSTSRRTICRALAEAGVDAGRREPAGRADRQAGALRRPLHLGLHRPRAEPQGAGHGRPGAADPRRRLAVRLRPDPGRSDVARGLPAPGQCRRRGHQVRRRPRRLDGFLDEVEELGRVVSSG